MTQEEFDNLSVGELHALHVLKQGYEAVDRKFGKFVIFLLQSQFADNKTEAIHAANYFIVYAYKYMQEIVEHDGPVEVISTTLKS